jgi:hypothetical protein
MEVPLHAFLTWHYTEMNDKLHSSAALPSEKEPPVPVDRR